MMPEPAAHSASPSGGISADATPAVTRLGPAVGEPGRGQAVAGHLRDGDHALVPGRRPPRGQEARAGEEQRAEQRDAGRPQPEHAHGQSTVGHPGERRLGIPCASGRRGGIALPLARKDARKRHDAGPPDRLQARCALEAQLAAGLLEMPGDMLGAGHRLEHPAAEPAPVAAAGSCGLSGQRLDPHRRLRRRLRLRRPRRRQPDRAPGRERRPGATPEDRRRERRVAERVCKCGLEVAGVAPLRGGQRRGGGVRIGGDARARARPRSTCAGTWCARAARSTRRVGGAPRGGRPREAAEAVPATGGEGLVTHRGAGVRRDDDRPAADVHADVVRARPRPAPTKTRSPGDERVRRLGRCESATGRPRSGGPAAGGRPPRRRSRSARSSRTRPRPGSRRPRRTASPTCASAAATAASGPRAPCRSTGRNAPAGSAAE